MVTDEGEVSREQKEAIRKHYVWVPSCCRHTGSLCHLYKSRFDVKNELHMSKRDSYIKL